MNKKISWNWDIHYACNYRCSYCFLSGKWDRAAKENRYPGIKKWIQVWDKIYDQYGSSHIHFSGGEPFTYPDFFELAIYLSQKNTLAFSTNLFFQMRPFIEKIDPGKVQLNPSFHPEFAKMEEFLEKVRLLKSNGFSASITFVAYPKQLKQMQLMQDESKKRGINFIVQLFRGKYKNQEYPQSYTDREKETIKSCGGNFPVNQALRDYHLKKKEKERRLCHMGQFYGKVYACADVYRCCSTGAQKIGNLLDDQNFSLLDKAQTCEIEDCLCWKRMVVGEEDQWKAHWLV